jgi:signal transduction histidine kinase
MKDSAQREPWFWVWITACLLLVGVVAWLRLAVFGRTILPIGYAAPLVIAGCTRYRRLFWGVVAAFALLTVWRFGYQLNQYEPGQNGIHAARGAAALADLLLTAIVIDLLFKNRRDIIRRKEEIEAQNARLKQQAAELENREAVLIRSRADAEEASNRKSRFLAAVSHDIRTPANAISLLADLIQRSANDPKEQAEVAELAKELQKCSMGLVGLVGDVLDLTRLDLGKVELNPIEFDLGQWMIDECAKLQPLAEEKKLRFDFSRPPESVRVRCDQIKLGRVLTNLIENAVKYTHQGEVQVRIEHLDGGGPQISVRDTGIGIPAEQLTKIFDEYYQLKNPERDRNKGTGLGLSISKRLLEAMGGRLTVQSAQGQGSTFTVTLPASMVVR